MTEFDNEHDNYESQSWQQMLAEIGRLLLLLLAKMGKLLLRYVLRGLKWVLKWICKGILALIDFTELCIVHTRAFWNDNDTQAKLRKMRRGTAQAAAAAGRYSMAALRGVWRGLCWLAVHVWRGSVWLGKYLLDAIVHLGPTLQKMGRAVARGAVAVGRRCRLWTIRRRRAYAEFRRNKGFKGLLIDVGVWLKKQLNNYIEEERAEENVADEDELFPDADDVPFEAQTEGEGRVHTFGRGIYNAMRRIVEED